MTTIYMQSAMVKRKLLVTRYFTVTSILRFRRIPHPKISIALAETTDSVVLRVYDTLPSKTLVNQK